MQGEEIKGIDEIEEAEREIQKNRWYRKGVVIFMLALSIGCLVIMFIYSNAIAQSASKPTSNTVFDAKFIINLVVNFVVVGGGIIGFVFVNAIKLGKISNQIENVKERQDEQIKACRECKLEQKTEREKMEEEFEKLRTQFHLLKEEHISMKAKMERENRRTGEYPIPSN